MALVQQFVLGKEGTILHMRNAQVDKYANFEMLHVSVADRRRLVSGHVTIQQLSRKSFWIPCHVKSRKTIELPGSDGLITM